MIEWKGSLDDILNELAKSRQRKAAEVIQSHAGIIFGGGIPDIIDLFLSDDDAPIHVRRDVARLVEDFDLRASVSDETAGVLAEWAELHALSGDIITTALVAERTPDLDLWQYHDAYRPASVRFGWLVSSGDPTELPKGYGVARTLAWTDGSDRYIFRAPYVRVYSKLEGGEIAIFWAPDVRDVVKLEIGDDPRVVAEIVEDENELEPLVRTDGGR